MRNQKLRYCPFCKGLFEIVCIDENDNMEDAQYLEDYPELKHQRAYTYGILHTAMNNPNCPIATVGRTLLGEVEYDSVDDAVETINRRATT